MKKLINLKKSLLSFLVMAFLLKTEMTMAQIIVPTPNISVGGAGMAALTYPFFPIRNEGGANLFWGQDGTEFLKVSSLSGNLQSGALYSELYSGFFKDIIRVGLGATVAAAKDDPNGEKTTLQRQISGGGLMTLNFQYPLIAIPFRSNFGMALIASPRVGADIPAAGNSTKNVTASTDLGGEFHLMFSTDDRKLIFPFQLRGAYVLGTKDFRASINQASNFGYLHFSGGIQYEVLRINFGGIISGPSSIKRQIEPQLSVTLVKSI